MARGSRRDENHLVVLLDGEVDILEQCLSLDALGEALDLQNTVARVTVGREYDARIFA